MKAVLIFAFLANGSILISAVTTQFQFNPRANENRQNFVVAAAATANGQRSCCSPSASTTRVQQVAAPESQRQEELVAAGATFGQESFAQRPQTFGAFGGGGGSSGGQGGNLQVECQRREVSPGQYKFICEGVQKDLITLRSEHILWLQSNGGKQQILDIEVPNYKIDELIKAGFKTTAVGGTRINVLLKKPEQVYDAEVDIPSIEGGAPSVNLQYEPVQKQVVHFPVDKAYRPLSGPIPEPGGGGGRFQRQAPDPAVMFSKRVN